MAQKIEYHPPHPSLVTKKGIMQFAEEQRRRVKLTNGFQLADLVKRSGGRLTYIDFDDEDQIDAVVVEPDESFLIRLSSYTGALRDNFTIAHELGHKVMHWPKVKKKYPGAGMKATRRVDNSDAALVRCEWEANWFASAFLMPADEFKASWKNGTASETFGVTEAAAEIRAKTLGLTE